MGMRDGTWRGCGRAGASRAHWREGGSERRCWRAGVEGGGVRCWGRGGTKEFGGRLACGRRRQDLGRLEKKSRGAPEEEKNPNNKQVSVVGKAGGEKWKSLTDDAGGPEASGASDKSKSEINDEDDGSEGDE